MTQQHTDSWGLVVPIAAQRSAYFSENCHNWQRSYQAVIVSDLSPSGRNPMIYKLHVLSFLLKDICLTMLAPR
eukprot:CAMPEP_0177546462 /NCGR_PEP_ID=MMETSP0369-20130122/63236_1 /TAXON_ID=447022 ORGANISM="Scrippsiella hangoei-like, Strain SHHI-4" /NCGR_SAMPLE_ID=MMETSP0369 /ASSEMBLY_ACC=CAM_ASM_000364 /LENGTH=72 /DNA_ID=CAMNT_0019030967 /DNA_START=133 /DNA_END=351 /DNA_ORIENTATION=+